MLKCKNYFVIVMSDSISEPWKEKNFTTVKPYGSIVTILDIALFVLNKIFLFCEIIIM